MGSTSASVSTVLAAFFLGLAGGSYLAERIVRDRSDSLAVYILLEAAIAACGIALLPLLLNLDQIMAALPRLGTLIAAKFAVTVALLCLPTLCMGATYPVLATILVRRQSEMGSRIGQLYALNTAGAVLGAAGSGFVLIPTVGLDGAVYVAAGLNLAVVMLALALTRRIDLPPIHEAGGLTRADAPESDARRGGVDRLALLVLFVTGLVSIATEVGWTKYLAIFTGATIYGFSAILSVFLIGIALGSWLMQRFIDGILRPASWLAAGLIALGASLLLARAGLAYLPLANEYIHAHSLGGYELHAFRYASVFIALIAPTLVFGALFPLSLQVYCGRVSRVRRRVGRGYALNTLGSILGAVGAGFWAIPTFGTDILLLVMALTVVFTAVPFLFVVEGRGSRLSLSVALLLLMISVAWWPAIDYRELLTSVRYRYDRSAQAGVSPTYLFLAEGNASIVSLITYDGLTARLQSNGIQESSVRLRSGASPPRIDTILAYVPYFVHSDPSSAFSIGFGGGNTLNALTHTELESIRVVELEPAMVEAVGTLTNGQVPALSDPRVSIAFNDARNALLVEGRSYDIIVSQPSHPWTAGAGNLFTQRFFEIVKSRLNRNGVFAQWVNLFNMDANTLRAIFQAYYGVFAHGFVLAYPQSGDLILIGSAEPIRFDFDEIRSRMNRSPIREILASWGFTDATGWLWNFSLSRREALEAAGDIAPNTDTRILSEVRLAALTADPKGEHSPYELLARHADLDLLPYLDEASAARSLYELGLFFAKYRSKENARIILDRLGKLDPVLADQFAREATVRDLDVLPES